MIDRRPTTGSESAGLPLAPGNRLLARLAPRDLALLRPGLERVVLFPHQVMLDPGDLVPYIHFPERDTIVGLYRPMADGQLILAAAASFGSAVGLVEATGDSRSMSRAAVLMGGPSLRISAALFTTALRQSAPLRAMLAHYTEALVGQLMQNAACNACHSVEQRVARWIITAHDVAQEGAQADPGDAVPLPLTQGMLADMLGVQRSSVTLAAGRLQAEGLVHHQRGRILIADRPGLDRRACGCHAAIGAIYRRLLAKRPESEGARHG